MASSPSLPLAPETRLLVVVVFTDVVGFTSRVQADESRTLKLLERDFALMRKSSQGLLGTVLKTTGDGLLMYFTSAVRAMAWAIRTQRYFAERARNEPADDILHHRVGIHLGDVYIKADDVMGDGVNIAARLLAEAPPGGICISQTVYDVVRNKLKLHVVRLEPRKLKNIKEPMQMYHVLLDAPQRIVPATTGNRVGMPVPAPTASPPVLSRRRKLAATGLALLTMGVVTLLIVQAHYEQNEELARSQAAGAALGALLTGKAAPAVENVAEPAETKVAAPANGAITAGEYDFAKMTVARPAGSPGASGDETLILQRANEGMRVLLAWLNTELLRFTRNRPLEAAPLGEGPLQRRTWFTSPDGQLHLAIDGATRTRDWHTLKPEEQAAIIVSVLRDVPSPPPRDVVQGAEAFAYVHRLPEMAKALLRARGPGDGSAP